MHVYHRSQKDAIINSIDGVVRVPDLVVVSGRIVDVIIPVAAAVLGEAVTLDVSTPNQDSVVVDGATV
uniref:Baseplate assembly protein n=1 Tax=Panagrellus redivivus TaxID=6233 RepID=A0A7E4W7V8_PANRE